MDPITRHSNEAALVDVLNPNDEIVAQQSELFFINKQQVKSIDVEVCISDCVPRNRFVNQNYGKKCRVY